VTGRLILFLKERLIRRARVVTKGRGKSIWQMVSGNFSVQGLPSSREADEPSPWVKSLKGVLKGSTVDTEEYQRHLEELID
jgi:hypothetical protein